jgi:hypothetical protein
LQGLPPQYVVHIHSKPFLRFRGLLQMAHARGLTSLKEHCTQRADTVALAHAGVTFRDGRVCEEAGESSTQDTVGREVKPHWRRMP